MYGHSKGENHYLALPLMKLFIMYKNYIQIAI